ncbi:hypothetical protein F4777DRAFT_552316 [Nemania sp. FL0916]|nr:hypothetical protein F4777DRAFT_552316 [Nemania sp. FL0916]
MTGMRDTCAVQLLLLLALLYVRTMHWRISVKANASLSTVGNVAVCYDCSLFAGLDYRAPTCCVFRLDFVVSGVSLAVLYTLVHDRYRGSAVPCSVVC